MEGEAEWSTTWLGVPRWDYKLNRYVRGGASLDVSVSNIGGKPNWLLPHPPSEAQLMCPLCGAPMMHLCQAYAPLETAHRTLNVFGCNTVKCSAESGSWLVLRSQKPFESDGATATGGDALADGTAHAGSHAAPAGSSGGADPCPSLGNAPSTASPALADWGIQGADDWGATVDEWGSNATDTADEAGEADEAGLL